MRDIGNWSRSTDLRVLVFAAQLLPIGALMSAADRRFSASEIDSKVDDNVLVETESAPTQDTPKQVAVLGAGYVGLTQALGMCKLGHTVVCADINQARVLELQAGIPPIFEEGLEELLAECNQSGRLTFTDKPVEAAAQAEFIFLCVATPQRDDGAADLNYLETAAAQIGSSLTPGAVVINKSTVPVGSADMVSTRLGRSDVEVVSNPEFLREGTAIADWFGPDRVVVGGERAAAERVLALYDQLPGERVVVDAPAAELIKYASNAYLATRLTFVNSISQLCDAIGADVLQVTEAMGLDARIGPRYLQAGPGWGGSCLPKDTHALAYQADQAGVGFDQLRATIAANDAHLDQAAEAILASRTPDKPFVVAALGLAFKAGTDDMRESPAVKIVERLVAAGAQVKAYDPGVPECSIPGVELSYSGVECSRDADVVAVLTEWPEFKSLDFEKVSEVMCSNRIVDVRNLLDAKKMAELGFQLYQPGRPPIPAVIDVRSNTSARRAPRTS